MFAYLKIFSCFAVCTVLLVSEAYGKMPSNYTFTLDDYLFWFKKGRELHDAGRIKEAIACYDIAIQLNPQFVEALNNKGSALHDLGHYTEALSYFEKALKLNSKDPDIWYNKALSLGMLGKHEQALECFDHVLKLRPNDVSAWFNKGIALIELRRYQEAIDCLEKVAKLDRTGQTGREALGIIQKLKNDKVSLHVYYEYEDNSRRCIKAVAMIDSVKFGEAKYIGLGGNEKDGYYIIVEETHYAPDGSGKVIYKAQSQFPDYGGSKIKEKPISGKKMLELFERWPKLF